MLIAQRESVVDAAMLEKPHVFGGEHGLDEMARHRVERQQRAMADDAAVAKR